MKTADVAVARAIARKIRERDGGLPAVKALGLMLESRGCAQVSMNLVDHEVTGVDAVNRAVEAEARALGVEVLGLRVDRLLPEQVERLILAKMRA